METSQDYGSGGSQKNDCGFTVNIHRASALRTHSANTRAVAVSMAQAAAEHRQLIKATPATVVGNIAMAATPARCRRVTFHHR